MQALEEGLMPGELDQLLFSLDSPVSDHMAGFMADTGSEDPLLLEPIELLALEQLGSPAYGIGTATEPVASVDELFREDGGANPTSHTAAHSMETFSSLDDFFTHHGSLTREQQQQDVLASCMALGVSTSPACWSPHSTQLMTSGPTQPAHITSSNPLQMPILPVAPQPTACEGLVLSPCTCGPSTPACSPLSTTWASPTACTFDKPIRTNERLLHAASHEEHLPSTPPQRQSKPAKKARTSSAAQRKAPKRPPAGSAQGAGSFKGVSMHKKSGKWEAHVWDSRVVRSTTAKTKRTKGCSVFVGAYATEAEAVRAYDYGSLSLFGEGGYTNCSKADYAADMPHIKASPGFQTPQSDVISSLRSHWSRMAKHKRRKHAQPIAGVVPHQAFEGYWEARFQDPAEELYEYLGVFSTEQRP